MRDHDQLSVELDRKRNRSTEQQRQVLEGIRNQLQREAEEEEREVSDYLAARREAGRRRGAR